MPARHTRSTRPMVGIIMGSASDAIHLEPARATLKDFGVPCEFRVVSAHRTPDLMFRYAEEAAARGIEVIIAAAGGAAHLPGMVASKTLLPVIGVPVMTRTLKGVDSLLSILQMPAGVPVATVAVNGAVNAALLAVRILALRHAYLRAALARHRTELRRKVMKMKV